jgi:hypothetical protein
MLSLCESRPNVIHFFPSFKSIASPSRVWYALISVANSLCPGQEKRTMREAAKSEIPYETHLSA